MEDLDYDPNEGKKYYKAQEIHLSLWTLILKEEEECNNKTRLPFFLYIHKEVAQNFKLQHTHLLCNFSKVSGGATCSAAL